MEVKSNLSGVRVGDELESLSCGRVKVLLVEKGYITCNTGFGTRLWTDDGNPAGDYTLRHPDLYWPGVQIIPVTPPKRMKKVTIHAKVALFKNPETGSIFPVAGNLREFELREQRYPDSRVSDYYDIALEAEVEDD